MAPGPPARAAGPAADERGFALLAVLLVVALLGVVGAEFAYSMRLEASAARAYKEVVMASHLAEAGVAQAMRELAADSALVALDPKDGALVFYTRDGVAIPRLPRTNVPLGEGAFSYRISDEQSRINVNTAQPDLIDRLLLTLGLDKRQRDVVNDSIQDWRDRNEEHRLNGAESDDYYLTLAVPYRSRNANLESVAELLQIRGVTPELYNGSEGHPGLVDLVTVRTQGQININTATDPVLKALGLSEAEITELNQGRRNGAYSRVPARFSGRALAVSSQTFRIEADGLIDGRSRATVTVIVQKRIDASGGVLTELEWSGIR
jgi:general secretion pathway protein K